MHNEDPVIGQNFPPLRCSENELQKFKMFSAFKGGVWLSLFFALKHTNRKKPKPTTLLLVELFVRAKGNSEFPSCKFWLLSSIRGPSAKSANQVAR